MVIYVWCMIYEFESIILGSALQRHVASSSIACNLVSVIAAYNTLNSISFHYAIFSLNNILELQLRYFHSAYAFSTAQSKNWSKNNFTIFQHSKVEESLSIERSDRSARHLIISRTDAEELVERSNILRCEIKILPTSTVAFKEEATKLIEPFLRISFTLNFPGISVDRELYKQTGDHRLPRETFAHRKNVP